MKINYWLLRLFLIIPTLLGIIFFGLVLTSTPSSSLLTAYEENDKSQPAHPRIQHDNYNQKIITSGVMLPLFYFSIQPKGLKKINQISDYRAHRAASEWIKFHDASLTYQYFSQMVKSLDTIVDARVYQDLQSLYFSGPEGSRSILRQKTMAQVSPNILSSLKSLQASSPSLVQKLPALQWNGNKNRFHQFLLNILQFNFGNSEIDGRLVSTKISEALMWTLQLSLPVLALSLVISFILAYLVVRYRGQWFANVIHGSALFLYAMPLFWIATLMIVFFTNKYYASGYLHWFEGVGIFRPDGHAGFLKILAEKCSFLLLPALCMTMSGLAFFYLQWKDNSEEEMNKPYIITAQSKGLKIHDWLIRHVFSNSAYTILGFVGLFFPAIISGSVIIEVLFNIPGMGRLMFTSIKLADWNVVMATIFLSALITYIGFILSDFLVHQLDPRK